MTEKEKHIRVTGGQIGVIGDNAHIEGGIHHHHYHGGQDTAIEGDRDSEPKIHPEPFNSTNAANILHLSDLHLGADKDADPAADAKRWASQLTDDLTGELGVKELKALIISGDISNVSEPNEYKAAEVFLDQICGNFGLGAAQVVLVPGNHDLNWSLSKKGYRLMDEDEHDGQLKDGTFIRVDDEVIRLRDPQKYPERFQHFSRFHEESTGQPYPPDPTSQATLNHFPALNLLVVGFNSVWEADHHFRNRISINPDAVSATLDRIRETPSFGGCFKVAVWHHPLVSPDEDRIRDHGFMQRLAQGGFEICLHGHIHKADAGLYCYDMAPNGRQIYIVGAGTFGAPSREWSAGYPLQYNLLRFSGKWLRVETRRRIEPNGTWEPDHQWRQGCGKPNLAHYDIPLSGSLAASSERGDVPPDTPVRLEEEIVDADLEKEIAIYCRKAESLHGSLPVAGFATVLKVSIDVEAIYIPLRAMLNLRGVDDLECYGDAATAEKHLGRCESALEISLFDAFREAEKRNQKGLVILGDPGSGKTTHMKRLLLWCLRNGPERLGLPRGMLPVFLPLRALRHIKDGLDCFIQEQLASRHLKMRADFGQRLLRRGNLLFLLDGLDEVADLTQREEVVAWIEEAFHDHPDCRFVVTCRFAGYSPSVRLNERFMEMHVRPMSEGDTETFVHKWYTIVEKGLARDVEQAESIAREKADGLIDHLRQPDFRARRVFELTRNPLLLTNICLVHRHRGTLPKRRSRLYEECVDVLLEHWRGAKKLDLGVNALQGRMALQPAALWLHQKEGRTRATVDELAPVIEPVLSEIQWAGGDAHDFLRVIRDESGLLTGWDQENYGFMHLGFQEYLAARQIRSRFQQEMNETGQSMLLRELAGHFGESWWQEVILLLLALEDPPLFVPFMREVVHRSSFTTHADFVEMCLDDAIKPLALPFIELIESDSGNDPEGWHRQLLALNIAARLDSVAIEKISERLIQHHPSPNIRDWFRDRAVQQQQKVIRPEPSGYELVLVTGGIFLMGSTDFRGEKPVHEVTFQDFYIGRYPVTNEEYGRFLAATGYREPNYWGNRNYNQPRQPVVGVSWDDARAFARWAGLQLPSEAQWEYACRAGTTTRYAWGDEPDCAKANYGNSRYSGECKKENPGKPSAVGSYPPNPWGLYDMHGNVWEWCQDYWHDTYRGAPLDGSPWEDQKKGVLQSLRALVKIDKDTVRVLRGGAWLDASVSCRAASRLGHPPGARIDGVGFRLVCLPGQPGEPGRSGQPAE